MRRSRDVLYRRYVTHKVGEEGNGDHLYHKTSQFSLCFFFSRGLSKLLSTFFCKLLLKNSKSEMGNSLTRSFCFRLFGGAVFFRGRHLGANKISFIRVASTAHEISRRWESNKKPQNYGQQKIHRGNEYKSILMKRHKNNIREII